MNKQNQIINEPMPNEAKGIEQMPTPSNLPPPPLPKGS